MMTVSCENDPATAAACARLRQRIFLHTYGKLGLQSWPGEPDRFDSIGSLFVARNNGAIVGTALLHHQDYDGTQPFWHEAFGVTVAELIAHPLGQRIGEIGRVAVDKASVANPLEVVAALSARITAAIRAAHIGPLIAVALSTPMMDFYTDLVRRAGALLTVHPRRISHGGLEMTFMVIRQDDRDYL
jgi:hypothetical protein